MNPFYACQAGYIADLFKDRGARQRVGALSGTQHNLIAIGARMNLLATLGANWVLVPIMGVSGIIAATAFILMVSFALLLWVSVSFTKQRNAP